jgi:hypothetical protein
LKLLKDTPDGLFMPGTGCPDEIVMTDAEFLPKRSKNFDVPLRQFMRGYLLFSGGSYHLHPVLVRASQKEGFLADGPMEASDNVSTNGRIHVPQMRFGIGVVDRRSYVKMAVHGLFGDSPGRIV